MPRAGTLVSGPVWRERPAGLQAGVLLPRGLVSPVARQEPATAPPAHSRARARTASFWVSPHLGVAPPGGLGGESQTRPTPLPPGRLAAAHVTILARPRLSGLKPECAPGSERPLGNTVVNVEGAESRLSGQFSASGNTPPASFCSSFLPAFSGETSSGPRSLATR